jgi:hypothetical protein
VSLDGAKLAIEIVLWNQNGLESATHRKVMLLLVAGDKQIRVDLLLTILSDNASLSRGRQSGLFGGRNPQIRTLPEAALAFQTAPIHPMIDFRPRLAGH